MANDKKITPAILCGLLGCVCFGVGDWLMLYGDTAYFGTISWLTAGAAQIAPWRNNLAMALAFPGIILYGIALFAIGQLIAGERQQKVYHYLTAFSLTPWLCLQKGFPVCCHFFLICHIWLLSLNWPFPASDFIFLPVPGCLVSQIAGLVPFLTKSVT